MGIYERLTQPEGRGTDECTCSTLRVWPRRMCNNELLQPGIVRMSDQSVTAIRHRRVYVYDTASLATSDE